MRVARDGRRATYAMREEGVVVEVVPPGSLPRSLRVTRLAVAKRRSPATGYVVQCSTCRVLRQADKLVVVRP